MTPTLPFRQQVYLQYRRAVRAFKRFLGSVLGIFIGIGIFLFIMIVPAIQSLIGALLISFPVWAVVSWVLWAAHSSYMPATWWDGYWLCVLALFVLGIFRTLTGANKE